MVPFVFLKERRKNDVIISNDEQGKTITIADEHKSFTFAFEEIEDDLK